MQRKTIFSILLLLYLRLLLVDDQDKGGDDTPSSNGSDNDDTGDDKPAPQGPGDITVKSLVLNDYVDSDLGKDQGELDLNDQDTPGEVYDPSGDVWEPPAPEPTND